MRRSRCATWPSSGSSRGFLVRFIRTVEGNIIEEKKKREEPYDRATYDAIAKLLRLSVVITAVLVVLQTLGYSIAGVLAFGGIGGIAVGFAAKDLLANFFGGLIIYLDRPFAVGGLDPLPGPRHRGHGGAHRLAPHGDPHLQPAPALRSQRRLLEHLGAEPLAHEQPRDLRGHRHPLRRCGQDGGASSAT